MGRHRSWLARGRFQVTAKQFCFYVILVTHPKSYIETDHRELGGKPSKCRWGRVLSWKIPEFYSMGGARSKKQHFCFFKVPSPVLHTAYRKQFYPKPVVPRESRDSEGVSFESVTRHLGDNIPLKGAKKWSHDHTKIEKLHIGIHIKIHRFQKWHSFRSTTKNNEVITEKPFPNNGVIRRLWMLGRLELTLVVNTCF